MRGKKSRKRLQKFHEEKGGTLGLNRWTKEVKAGISGK